MTLQSFVRHVRRGDEGLEPLSGALPFDITEHPAAKTTVAANMLRRIADDVRAFAETQNSSISPRLQDIDKTQMPRAFAEDAAESSAALLYLQEVLKALLSALNDMKTEDEAMVQGSLPLLEHAANFVPDATSAGAVPEEERMERVKFILKRNSGRQPRISVPFLLSVLLSTTVEGDLSRLNPYLPPSTRGTPSCASPASCS